MMRFNTLLLMHRVLMVLEKANEKFSFVLFALCAPLQLAVVLGAYVLIAPSLMRRELVTGPFSITLTVVGCLFANCYIEFFFHRYLLHTAPIVWLRHFARQHRKHHQLTHIVRLNPGRTGGSAPIRNRFSIIKTEQHEASFFPYYGLGLFLLVFQPLFLLVKWTFPGTPIIFGGNLAVFCSYSLYEVWHAIEHLPYESWWRKRIEHPRWGKLLTRIYGFHQAHHMNPGCNEAIGGFLGLPIADWTFGTYKELTELPLNGRFATREDFSAPRPRWPISALDRFTKARETAFAKKRQAQTGAPVKT